MQEMEAMLHRVVRAESLGQLQIAAEWLRAEEVQVEEATLAPLELLQTALRVES